jgi:hypothetical protein
MFGYRDALQESANSFESEVVSRTQLGYQKGVG